MNILYLCLFLASQFALQSYVVTSNLTPASTFDVPLAAALALLQISLTYGCLLATTVNPPYKMPGKKSGRFVKIAGETGIWYTVIGGAMLVGAALVFPAALAARDLWAIIWQSVVAGSLVNGLFALPLTRHFLNQPESKSEDQQ